MLSAPMVLQPQAEYLESSLASALVALAHFDSLVCASQLSYQQQQAVHSLMFQMNSLAEELTDIFFVEYD